MASNVTLDRILNGGIIAVVRANSGDQLADAVRALEEGGVFAVEITFTVPDAPGVIRELRRSVSPNVILGAGTVLDSESARAALLAGAEFLVSPTVNLDVIRMARRYGVPNMPGAFTPTEILAAWEAGADVVKVFPSDVGGPNYFKALRGPLPHVRLMPTGGVDLKTAGDFLAAGAACLGVGGSLVEPEAIAKRDWPRIRQLALQFVEIVAKHRAART